MADCRMRASHRCGHRSARGPRWMRRLSTPSHGESGAWTNQLEAPTGRTRVRAGASQHDRGAGAGAGTSGHHVGSSARGCRPNSRRPRRALRAGRGHQFRRRRRIRGLCRERARIILPTAFLLCRQRIRYVLRSHAMQPPVAASAVVSIAWAPCAALVATATPPGLARRRRSKSQYCARALGWVAAVV
jgi:hypothetical protein